MSPIPRTIALYKVYNLTLIPRPHVDISSSFLGNKKMQMRVKIYPASKRLYHSDNPGHKLSACNRLAVFQKCLCKKPISILNYIELFFILPLPLGALLKGIDVHGQAFR